MTTIGRKKEPFPPTLFQNVVIGPSENSRRGNIETEITALDSLDKRRKTTEALMRSYSIKKILRQHILSRQFRESDLLGFEMPAFTKHQKRMPDSGWSKYRSRFQYFLLIRFKKWVFVEKNWFEQSSGLLMRVTESNGNASYPKTSTFALSMNNDREEDVWK